MFFHSRVDLFYLIKFKKSKSENELNILEVDRDVLISNDHFLVHYIFQIIEKIFKIKTNQYDLFQKTYKGCKTTIFIFCFGVRSPCLWNIYTPYIVSWANTTRIKNWKTKKVLNGVMMLVATALCAWPSICSRGYYTQNSCQRSGWKSQNLSPRGTEWLHALNDNACGVINQLIVIQMSPCVGPLFFALCILKSRQWIQLVNGVQVYH